MKTILYLITQSELGGAQKYVFDLASNLKNDYEIIVAFGEQGEQGEVAGWLKQENIPYYVIPHLKRSISPWNDLLAIFEIAKLIKKVKPDIIHLNSSKISILGSLASIYIRIIRMNSDIRIIYTAHGWVFNEPMNKLKKLFYLYAEKMTARWKDKIICVSEFDRKIGIENKIAPENKLITIHNGIDRVDFYSKDEAINNLQKEIGNWKLEIGQIIIGSIGNLYPTKGYEHLIRAIKLLISNFKFQISLVIVGEGSERPKLEKLIKDLKLKDKVFLPGRKDFSARIMPAFDIYICSSVKEGLSYTVMEAMQAGLPIIATKVGGNPELIQNNENGLLVESKNPDALARTLERLIRDENLRNKLKANAKIKSKEFTLEKMVVKTNQIYQNKI